MKLWNVCGGLNDEAQFLGSSSQVLPCSPAPFWAELNFSKHLLFVPENNSHCPSQQKSYDLKDPKSSLGHASDRVVVLALCPKSGRCGDGTPGRVLHSKARCHLQGSPQKKPRPFDGPVEVEQPKESLPKYESCAPTQSPRFKLSSSPPFPQGRQ